MFNNHEYRLSSEVSTKAEVSSIENPLFQVKFHHPATRDERQATFFEQIAQKTPLHLSRELYKSNLFMQNKANSLSVQYDTTSYYTRTYEILVLKISPKKQSQTKPIQTQF